jgi:hypothetical protein
MNGEMDFQELVTYVKVLGQRIDKLEKENEKLKGCVLKKKPDILDQLNDDSNIPSLGFKEWIESLDYSTSIETVFREDLLTGMIEVLEKGVNKVSILDSSELPLRVFSNKPNQYYVYDIDNEGDKESKWSLILNVDLDKWFNYIGKRFLIEFKAWFDHNEELIKNDERMSNKYVEFLQKTLGGQRMTEEGRNHRIRQHIYKVIKQSKL